jgi:dihydrofolate reductase
MQSLGPFTSVQSTMAMKRFHLAVVRKSAIDQARVVAGGKDIKLGGASPCKQALAAGLCDEILIHLAPCLLGGGVRLFDALPDGIRLEKLSVSDGPFATHIRYRVAGSLPDGPPS